MWCTTYCQKCLSYTGTYCPQNCSMHSIHTQAEFVIYIYSICATRSRGESEKGLSVYKQRSTYFALTPRDGLLTCLDRVKKINTLKCLTFCTLKKVNECSVIILINKLNGLYNTDYGVLKPRPGLAYSVTPQYFLYKNLIRKSGKSSFLFNV